MDHLAEYRPGGLTRYSPAASRGLDQGESLVVIGLQTSNYQSINQSRNQQYWYGPSSLGLHQRPAEVSIRGKVLWSSVYRPANQSINRSRNQQDGPSSLGLHQRPAEVSIAHQHGGKVEERSVSLGVPPHLTHHGLGTTCNKVWKCSGVVTHAIMYRYMNVFTYGIVEEGLHACIYLCV